MKRPYIEVVKSEFVLKVVTDEGTETYPVTIGANPDGADKQEEGDRRTSEGDFTIVSIEDSSDWDREGERVYGPLFLRLDCPPWEGIGIHGTNEPELVGTRSSLGCVRLRNEDLAEVAGKVSAGTLVRILA